MGYTGRKYDRKRWARYMREQALKSRYKPNSKSIEIIGLPSAILTHITTDSVPGSLTETIFDTTSRADSAQILLTNSTGSSKVIIAAWIRGKPVTRLSNGGEVKGLSSFSPARMQVTPGGGFLHDKFVDYERIAQDGDLTFETGNNFVVTADQTNKLADYYWKLNRTKKHIYALDLVGFQSWFEPGEWYTLQIGGAGQAEYISSTVECFDVRCSIASDSAPYTSVSFREVQENWKFDSNEVARQIAAGGFTRRPTQNRVIVASLNHCGYADYYCDYNDDHVEINAAITFINQIGGGEVHLTKGEFYITSTITMLDNVGLYGEGYDTSLYFIDDPNPFTYCIDSIGSSASHITNVTIANLKMRNPIGYSHYGIRAQYAENISIRNVVVDGFDNAIEVRNLMPGFVEKNIITNGKGEGISLYETATTNSSVFIIDNDVESSYELGGVNHGIQIFGFSTSGVNTITVSGNHVREVGASSAKTGYGMYISGAGIVCANNRVENCSPATNGTCYGYYIATGSTNCIMANNYAFNNGADTGLGNENGNNFKDMGTDTQWAG